MNKYILIFLSLLIFNCDDILDESTDFYIEGITNLSGDAGKLISLDIKIMSEDENPEIVSLALKDLPENASYEFSNQSGSTNFNSKLSIWINSIGVFPLEIVAQSGNNVKTYPLEVEIIQKPLTDQQVAAKALAEGSPWGVSAVISKPDPAVDVTELENLTLTFGVTGTGSDLAPGDFTANGAPNFFTATSASWSWAGSGLSTINIVGTTSISQLSNVSFSPSVENISKLTLTFTVQHSGGRIQSGIVGDYTIELIPQ